MEELDEASLPIFKVERVQLQFSISSDFVAAQVANNVLVLALSTGRILRIDLDSPSDIDGGRLESCASLPHLTCITQTSICPERLPRLG